MVLEKKIRLLADQFLKWMTPYGRIDPEKCPLVETDLRVMPSNFHSPTYWAIAFYRTYSVTKDSRYKDAADRIITFYFACLRNARTPEQGEDFYLTEWLKFMEEKCDGQMTDWRLLAHSVRSFFGPAFMPGMALAGYRYFKRYNPNELALDTKAGAHYDWLQDYRWAETSWFRCGVGSWRHGVTDFANADDLAHVGRGLVGYYEVTRRDDVLADALGLAQYYLNEMELGSYRGCWSSEMGTWAAAPNEIDSFEHYTGVRCCDIAFVVTANATTEYLTDLAGFANDKAFRDRVAPKCASSMRWVFDKCQFEDGAIGLTGLDDACVGSAGMGIMTYLRCREAGFLNEADKKKYLKKALLARDWMLNQITPEVIQSGGYIKITGKSTNKPLDNLAWFMGQALESMAELEKL